MKSQLQKLLKENERLKEILRILLTNGKLDILIHDKSINENCKKCLKEIFNLYERRN
jgi:ubiquinone/menaquinone biosynthesis C-methylase UbiE